MNPCIDRVGVCVNENRMFTIWSDKDVRQRIIRYLLNVIVLCLRWTSNFLSFSLLYYDGLIPLLGACKIDTNNTNFTTGK